VGDVLLDDFGEPSLDAEEVVSFLLVVHSLLRHQRLFVAFHLFDVFLHLLERFMFYLDLKAGVFEEPLPLLVGDVDLDLTLQDEIEVFAQVSILEDVVVSGHVHIVETTDNLLKLVVFHLALFKEGNIRDKRHKLIQLVHRSVQIRCLQNTDNHLKATKTSC